MTTTQSIFVGIALVLLLGGTGMATFAKQAADEVPAAITVPVGHVGDELTYAYFEREGPRGDWEPAGTEVFRVEAMRTTLGAAGEAFETVVVSQNATDSTGFLFQATDVSLVTPSTTLFEHVDVSSRYAVRTEVKTARDDISLGFTEVHVPRLDTLQFQGLELRPGADVAHLAWVDEDPLVPATVMFSFSFPFPLAPQHIVMLSTFDLDLVLEVRIISSTVAEGGTIDGEDVLGVQTRFRVAFEGSEREFEGSRTDFYSARVPYPVASEWRYSADSSHGRVEGRSLRHLAAFTAGDGDAIAWDGPPGPRPSPRPPSLERSSVGLRGGPASRMPYALDDALQDAMQHPSFMLWSAQNPEHALVSAALSRTGQSSSTAPVHRWSFGFGDPSASVFYVTTERAEDAPVGASEASVIAAPSDYDPDDVPTTPVLLSEVEKAWRLAASEEYAEGPPDHLLWGLAHGSSSSDAICPLSTGSAPTVHEDVNPFTYVVLGRSNAGECSSVDGVQRTSALVFDVVNGTPLWSFEMRQDMDREVLPLGGASQPAVAATWQDPDFPAPAVATGMIALGGLLLVALVAYLLPAIKFGLAKLALLIPGFSRLQRDALLDHGVRDELMQHIQAEPGLHAQELRRRVGVGWGTLVHHIGVLERNKLVSSLVEGRNRRFFPVGATDWSDRGRIAVLQHPKTKQVYDIVLGGGGLATGAIAKKLGVTTAGAMWHLRRLDEMGLVERRKVGRTVYYQGKPVDVGGRETIATARSS